MRKLAGVLGVVVVLSMPVRANAHVPNACALEIQQGLRAMNEYNAATRRAEQAAIRYAGATASRERLRKVFAAIAEQNQATGKALAAHKALFDCIARR